MIFSLLEVVLPVFLIVTGGYCTTRFHILTSTETNGVLKFNQTVAIPIFLFLNMLGLDLISTFNWKLLFSYYFGAIFCFLVGVLVSKKYLNCSTSEATVIGFCVLFSNAVLLGLPITALAYGDDSLGPNLAIISVNAPICYLIGITVMEFSEENNPNIQESVTKVLKTITSNHITMSIIFGLIFNLTGIDIFIPLYKALDLVSTGAISIALFALGGIMVDYKLSENTSKLLLIAILSIIFHPIITFLIGYAGFMLSPDVLRSGMITAVMGPGINAFIFSSIYKREMDVAAGAVLICTPLSIFATLFWLTIL